MGATASVDSTKMGNGFKPPTSQGHRHRSLHKGHPSNTRLRTSHGSSPVKLNILQDLMDTKFSFEAAYAKLEPVMHELKKFDSAKTDVITPALDFLFSYTSSKYGLEISQMWVEKLEKLGMVPIVMKLWPSFWQPDLLQCADKASGNGVEKDNITLENFWFVCRIIWNGSDASVALCESLVNTGTVEEMLKILVRKDFESKTMKRDEVRSYITKAATGIINNCLRNYYQVAEKRMRAADGVSIVLPYVQSDTAVLAAKASVLLAQTVHNAHDEMGDVTDDVIKTITKKLLEPPLTRSSRRAHGFSPTDTLEAACRLARDDQCKTKLVQNQIVPICTKIMENPANEQELLAAVQLVWILSFCPEMLESKKTLSALESVMQPLRKHNNEQLALAAYGTLWNINGKVHEANTKRTHSGPPSDRQRGRPRVSAILATNDRHSSASSLPAKKSVLRKSSFGSAKGLERNAAGANHIFISAHSAQIEIAGQLNEALQKDGYQTYITTNQKHAARFEEFSEWMAHSIAVIICVSELYETDPTCRAEAEHAFRLGKDVLAVKLEKMTPSGWLGSLLGSRLFFQCLRADDVASCANKLAKEFGNRAKLPENLTAIHHNGKHKKEADEESPERQRQTTSSSAKEDPRKDTKSKHNNITRTHKHTNARDKHKSDSKHSKDRSKQRSTERPKTIPEEENGDRSAATSADSDKSGPPDRDKDQVPIKHSASPRAQTHSERPMTSDKRVHLWTSEDVQAWLAHVGLEHVAKNFKQFDGNLLLELRHMYRTSPQVFYTSAKEQLGLTHLSDLLRVTQHLNQLPVKHDD